MSNRNRILVGIGISAVVIVLVAAIGINSRFQNAEAQRIQAASTIALARLTQSRVPADAADTQTLVTSAMPRSLDEDQLFVVISEIAAGFDLDIIDTLPAWQERLIGPRADGATSSASNEITEQLGFTALVTSRLVEPVTSLITVRGAISDINAFMTSLSEAQSRDPNLPQLLLRRSAVLLTFEEEIAIATFEAIGMRLNALPPEVRVVVGGDAP
jgi:type II secretory pathway pseudopilin PulG